MRKLILTIILLFVFSSPVLASHWVKLGKIDDDDVYYDRDSYTTYREFDVRNPSITLRQIAHVWIKKAKENEPVMWSIDCTWRKINKSDNDNFEYGTRIVPDSMEEKLFKKVCPRD